MTVLALTVKPTSSFLADHLQVSKTYFMAVCMVWLAIVARLYSCTLHIALQAQEQHRSILAALATVPLAVRKVTAHHMQQLALSAQTCQELMRLR